MLDKRSRIADHYLTLVMMGFLSTMERYSRDAMAVIVGSTVQYRSLQLLFVKGSGWGQGNLPPPFTVSHWKLTTKMSLFSSKHPFFRVLVASVTWSGIDNAISRELLKLNVVMLLNYL